MGGIAVFAGGSCGNKEAAAAAGANANRLL